MNNKQSLKILSDKEVYQLLPMTECIDLMAETLQTLEAGNGINPLRNLLRFPNSTGLLGMMPATLETPQSAGIKIVSVMPSNHGTNYDSHQGMVLVFERKHGCLVAMVEASSITAIRTAAVSGWATQLLARPGASRLAILGSGVQAKSHLEAMCAVRPISSVTVWSRNMANAERFAKQESTTKLTIQVAPSAQAAVADVDIICTTTGAKEPILLGEWLPKGVHINAVGACFAAWRELDTEAVVRSRLFVDCIESAVNEAGAYIIPLREGHIQESHLLGELAAIAKGKIEGRTSPEEITLFKSLGIAVEDLSAAHYVYQKAEAQGVGTTVVINE